MIRKLKESDLPDIIELVKQYLDEAGADYPSVDLSYVANKFTNYIDGTFVAEHDGKVVGVFAFEPGDFMFGDQSFLTERWHFVPKEYRSKGVGKALLDRAKQHSDEIGRPLLLTSMQGIDLDRKKVYYENNGFNLLGHIFVYKKGKD